MLMYPIQIVDRRTFLQSTSTEGNPVYRYAITAPTNTVSTTMVCHLRMNLEETECPIRLAFDKETPAVIVMEYEKEARCPIIEFSDMTAVKQLGAIFLDNDTGIVNSLKEEFKRHRNLIDRVIKVLNEDDANEVVAAISYNAVKSLVTHLDSGLASPIVFGYNCTGRTYGEYLIELRLALL